jgi:hypothetical protein
MFKLMTFLRAIAWTAIAWTASTAHAADVVVTTKKVHVRHFHVHRLAVRETHVVEVAVRPPGVRYVINGSFFTGSGPSCFGWAPRQRVVLLAGEKHGQCTTAVFRNLSLGRTCEMTCG